MEGIVIFWILISLSFLEATLPESGHLTSKQEDRMIEKPTVWSKEKLLKRLGSNWLDAAEKFSRMGMAQSSNSIKDIMDFIRTGNVDKFKFMIEEGSISPDLDDGLFLNEACEKGQK